MLSLKKTTRTLPKVSFIVQRYSSTQSLLAWEEQLKKQDKETTLDEITSSQFNLLSNAISDVSFVDRYVDEHIPEKGSLLPPCYHHVYFPPRTREKDLADDGYETAFFPPKPFSQRMWVGAQIEWNQENPLRVGDKVKMKTFLDRAELREGNKGESAMVWINKDIENKHGWSMREQRCLVYHPEDWNAGGNSNSMRRANKKVPDFKRSITPSSILLFRYSALTFNSHKIHFDHKYATQVEGHPGCLVHGPLSGTLLVNSLRDQENRTLKSFEYKCLRPLYVNKPLTLCGRKLKDRNSYELWINDEFDNLAVKGTATVVHE